MFRWKKSRFISIFLGTKKFAALWAAKKDPFLFSPAKAPGGGRGYLRPSPPRRVEGEGSGQLLRIYTLNSVCSVYSSPPRGGFVLEPQSAGKEAEAALKRICASCTRSPHKFFSTPIPDSSRSMSYSTLKKAWFKQNGSPPRGAYVCF